MFCRQAAKELSAITPLLKERNIKNICIGLDEIGLEDFLEDHYFNGELYIDKDKQTYKSLKYKKYSLFSYFHSLANKKAYAVIIKGINEGDTGDLKGDTFQNGGTIIVKKGGEEVLFHFRQEHMIEHVNTADILRVLNIPVPILKDVVPQDNDIFVIPDGENVRKDGNQIRVDGC